MICADRWARATAAHPFCALTLVWVPLDNLALTSSRANLTRLQVDPGHQFHILPVQRAKFNGERQNHRPVMAAPFSPSCIKLLLWPYPTRFVALVPQSENHHRSREGLGNEAEREPSRAAAVDSSRGWLLSRGE